MSIAINRLFDDMTYACHKAHMMALALELVIQEVTPTEPSSLVIAPGYLPVTVQDQELVSFLVDQVAMAARLAKETFQELEEATAPLRFGTAARSEAHG